MGSKKTQTILVILAIVALFAIGIFVLKNASGKIGGDQPSINNEQNQQETGDTSEISNSNTNVDITEFIYDLASLVETKRTPDDMEKYPAYRLNTEVLMEETDEEVDDKKVAGTDTAADAAVNNYKVTYYNHETIDNFLKDTGIEEKDIADLYMAYYIDNNYIVGLLSTNGDSDATLIKLDEYKNKLMVEHENENNTNPLYLAEYNRCIVVVLGENAMELGDQIIMGVKDVTELLVNSYK